MAHSLNLLKNCLDVILLEQTLILITSIFLKQTTVFKLFVAEILFYTAMQMRNGEPYLSGSPLSCNQLLILLLFLNLLAHLQYLFLIKIINNDLKIEVRCLIIVVAVARRHLLVRL